jgi:hypothetical protein
MAPVFIVRLRKPPMTSTNRALMPYSVPEAYA